MNIFDNQESSLKTYIKEIGLTKLITPDQEVELARRFKEGDESARDLMIRANLRLVVRIASEYKNYGMSLPDLISEGNIGLMKAVERFDPSKGGKLSTYASWWIKQAIKRALANQSKTIRLPVHMVEKITRMRRVSESLHEFFGREPTDVELADELGMEVHKLSMLRQASMRTSSLDAPIHDGEVTEYAEIIGDEKSSDPLAILSNKNIQSELDGLLELLDERELQIITSRYGLGGERPKTLEEVGAEIGVTRERIRQVQNSALLKMGRYLKRMERGKQDPGIERNREQSRSAKRKRGS